MSAPATASRPTSGPGRDRSGRGPARGAGRGPGATPATSTCPAFDDPRQALDDPRQANYVQHGWNVTGDAYRMDEDGWFWYEARTDDMIVSAGYNIAGPEVEGALLAHPAVAECACIAAPDDERGAIVKAFVVLKEGFAPGDALTRELQEHVKQSIAPYKYPRAVEYVEGLPRTETGKLQRFRLRQMEEQRAREGRDA